MKNTVKALEAIADTRDIFVEEEITGYDVDKMKDLMPDFRMKILFLQNWFAGNIETTCFENDESDDTQEEPVADVVKEKVKPTTKREYKLMTKSSVKKVATIVATECKGFTTKKAIDLVLSKNKRFKRDSIRRIITQESFGDITKKYFTNENGIIA